MRSLLLTLLFVVNPVWAAPHLPYSMSWSDYMASKHLTPASQQLIRDIVLDSLWYDNEHEIEGHRFSRVKNGPRYGLEELDDQILRAERGDAEALTVLLVLLESSSFARPLAGLERGSIWTGTVISPPDNRSGRRGSLRQAIARALKERGGTHADLMQKLTAAALRDPNNTALVESVTALAAIPPFSTSPALRDYFLLMSVHPEPKVRISGLFGLASFTHDPLVREILLQTSQPHPEPSFSQEDEALVRHVLNEVGPKFPAWQDLLTEIYGRWQREPFPNRVRDRGDYNWERMANAAAAQALLYAVPLPQRNVTIKTQAGEVSTREVLRIRHSLPALNGLESGNGTGFRLFRQVMNEQFYLTESLYPATITIEPRPENAWILKGMNRQGRDRVFAEMMEAPIEVHFGHLAPLISLLKYKFLKLEPPADYHDSLAVFQSRLRSKWATFERELKDKKIRVLSTHEVCEALGEEAAPNQVIPFACKTKPAIARVESLEDQSSEDESVFVAPLESVYAARALAGLGEKSTAAQALVSLLPKAWTLTAAERANLAVNLETGRHDDYQSADLDDESKRALLGQVFDGLAEALGQADMRRLLIRWLTGLQDERLAQEARQQLAQTCEAWLRPK